MGPVPVFEPAVGGLGYEIFRALKSNKGKVAQHFIETGETLSYDELLERSIRTALFLAEKKLNKEDVVLMCSGNNINSSIPLIASKFVDVQFFAMEPLLPVDELIHLMNLLRPKVLFVAENAIPKIEDILEMLEIKCELISLGNNSSKYTSISYLFHPIDEEKNFRPTFVRDIKETALILPSSGTCGKPKGICLNHYSLLAQIYILGSKFHHKGTITFSNFSEEFGGEENSILVYSPLYWISGFLFNMISIFCGGSVILGSSFEAEVAWNALKRYKPDSLLLPPGYVHELCTFGFSQKPNLNVLFFGTGGGVVSVSHLRDLKRCFPNSKIVQAYGQTENTGTLTLFSNNSTEELEYQEKHLNSCGRPVDGYMMKVKHIDTGKICRAREPGELVVKNKYIMNGYFKMDSSSMFDSDGWFKTGDYVYFDENGYIYIVDRIKDILFYSVHNITPSVIEDILRQHPAVFECCVIGKPHLRDYEHPMGIVVLREAHKEGITEEEIVSFVNERVYSDKYKIRAGIKFVDSMLKTATGKLRKIEMKRRIIEGIAF